MDVYPNNSNRFKEKDESKKQEVATKKVEKVITGGVRTKKKSKIVDSFISEDVEDVKNYLIGDILIPTLKKTLSEMVSNGIDMMLFGEVRSNKNKKRNRADRVSYRDYYDRDDRRERRTSHSSYDYEDIVLNSRGEADAVLDRMEEIIDHYDAVTITDLYDLVGYDGGRYTDSDYGWTSMRNAEVKRTRDGGYLLKLPPAKPID
mgnify:CR=1 FL=1